MNCNVLMQFTRCSEKKGENIVKRDLSTSWFLFCMVFFFLLEKKQNDRECEILIINEANSWLSPEIWCSVKGGGRGL